MQELEYSSWDNAVSFHEMAIQEVYCNPSNSLVAAVAVVA
jgi:hypothetical protein